MKFNQVYCKESYDLVHFGEILVQSSSKYIKTVSLNLFLVSLSNVPFLYSLKTLEKLRFQGGGSGNGALFRKRSTLNRYLSAKKPFWFLYC